jgi:hypothetical protein
VSQSIQLIGWNRVAHRSLEFTIVNRVTLRRM